MGSILSEEYIWIQLKCYISVETSSKSTVSVFMNVVVRS